jgi:hypothetical protein
MVSHMCHYLDDMFTCGIADTVDCYKNIEIMQSTRDECGIELNHQKTIDPTTCIEFLGIVIDSKKMELRISEERLAAVKLELSKWIDKKTGSKRELLSLLGKLVFVSKVISPGRTFMRRLYNLTMNLKHLHYKVQLSRDAREDIVWWLNCAANWNAKSVFLDEEWTTSEHLHIYTDASDVGLGCVFGSQWFSMEFNSMECDMIIAWRELYAMVLACFTWGQQFVGKKLIMHCDNHTIVDIMHTGTSKNRDIMCLVRVLYYICVQYNFDMRVVHIPGVYNVAADNLSRLNFDAFFAQQPSQYDDHPTPNRRSFD